MLKERRQRMTEKDTFDAAMDKLLKVPPQIVKDAMEQEKQHRAEERKAKRAFAARKEADCKP